MGEGFGGLRGRRGQQIGEYVIEELVGRGAFAEVWRARHEVFGEDVALKLPHLTGDPTSLEQEGRLLKRLSSAHIVRVLGMSLRSVPPYIAMSYMRGGDLAARIAQGPMPSPRVIAILCDMASALRDAHGSGVLHRDLKPANVLLDENGRAHLSDFGLGAGLQALAGSLANSLDEPAAGHWVGTIDYMSPEQRRGEEVDERADLYALGIICFEMLIGRRPAAAELPSDLRPETPAVLDAIYRRACAHIDNRFRRADELLAMLLPVRPADPGAQAGTAAPAVPPAASGRPAAPPKPSRPSERPCPVCRRSMRTIEVPDRRSPGNPIEIEKCLGCGGYFFDADEAEAAIGLEHDLLGLRIGLRHPRRCEPCGAALTLEAIAGGCRGCGRPIQWEGIRCPACSRPMITLNILGDWLDYCLHCHGFWFDKGEVKRLAGSYAKLLATPGTYQPPAPPSIGDIARQALGKLLEVVVPEVGGQVDDPPRPGAD